MVYPVLAPHADFLPREANTAYAIDYSGPTSYPSCSQFGPIWMSHPADSSLTTWARRSSSSSWRGFLVPKCAEAIVA